VLYIKEFYDNADVFNYTFLKCTVKDKLTNMRFSGLGTLINAE